MKGKGAGMMLWGKVCLEFLENGGETKGRESAR